MMAFDPDQISFAAMLMTETLCTTLLAGSVLALTALRRQGGIWRAGVAGALLGLTVLTRVNMLVLVPVVCVWLLRWGHGPLRSRLAAAAVIVGLSGACWGAWALRNYQVFGAFVPLTTQGGNGYYGVFNDEAARWPQPLESYGGWRYLPAPAELAGAGELARDRQQRAAALEWAGAHPIDAALVSLAQVGQLWRSNSGSPLFPALLALAALGARALHERGSPDGALWGLIAAALTLTAAVALAVPRFNIPLMPGMAALSWIGLERAALAARGLRRGRAAVGREGGV
jgi:4-amino-4-deoxy-L-arabinose transferase-like glycosyltransferase